MSDEMAPARRDWWRGAPGRSKGLFLHGAASLTGEARSLYDEAFDRFATVALWGMERAPDPTRRDALRVARRLEWSGKRIAGVLAADLRRAVREDQGR